MTLVTILSREDKQTTNGKKFVRVKMQMQDGKTAWASCWKPEVSPRIVAGEHLDVELETREDGGRQFVDIVSAAPPSLPLPGMEPDERVTNDGRLAVRANEGTAERIYRCTALNAAVAYCRDSDAQVDDVLRSADAFYAWLQGGQKED